MSGINIKTLRYYIIFSIAILSTIALHSPKAWADTEVNGTITSDTVWTKANSPYIIINTLQIFDSVTLTIEPGVVVKTHPNIKIKVAGNIIAQGQPRIYYI